MRLIALLEALAVPAVAPATAAKVQQFLRLATIVLPPSMRRPADNLARPPAVADLKVVRLGRPRYEPGAIAHIENVMASEKRERTHRMREEHETTVTREEERTEENEKDLSTTSQVQLQHEATRTLREETELEGGLHVSASYGPMVKVDADARVARHDSKEEASRTAASYSTQITQRARQKVVESIREQRVTRHLLETEETNLHSFTNQGTKPEHIVGVYRWVDQVQDAWVENYGKRLMLEYIVPRARGRAALGVRAPAPKPDGPGDPPALRPIPPTRPSSSARRTSPRATTSPSSACTGRAASPDRHRPRSSSPPRSRGRPTRRTSTSSTTARPSPFPRGTARRAGTRSASPGARRDPTTPGWSASAMRARRPRTTTARSSAST